MKRLSILCAIEERRLKTESIAVSKFIIFVIIICWTTTISSCTVGYQIPHYNKRSERKTQLSNLPLVHNQHQNSLYLRMIE